MRGSPSFNWSNKGVTLLELLIVLMIIGLLVTAAVKTFDVSLQRSRFNSTLKEMENLTWAIAGNPNLVTGGKRSDFGYVGDIGMLPPTLKDLYENTSNFPNWQGPYIKPAFQENPQSYMMDAWGDTYVYPNPLTLPDTSAIYIRSYAGGSVTNPQTWLTRVIANRKADILSNRVEGVIYDAYGDPPGTLDAIKLTIYYPRFGQIESLSYIPDSSKKSNFTFINIPMGNHKIKAIGIHPPVPPDTTVDVDTVEKYVCVYPRIGATGVEIRFPALKFEQ